MRYSDIFKVEASYMFKIKTRDVFKTKTFRRTQDNKM